MNQTEAIRAALAELGNEAETDEIRNWVKRKGVSPSASFDSIVSKERRKAQEAKTDTDLVQGMKALRELLDTHQDELPGLVEQFERVHSLCGGWQRVRELLDVLKPSEPKKKK